MKNKMKTRVPNVLFALICLLLLAVGLKAKSMADTISRGAEREEAIYRQYSAHRVTGSTTVVTNN